MEFSWLAGWNFIHNRTKSDYILRHFLHVTKILHCGYIYIVQCTYIRIAKEKHKKLYNTKYCNYRRTEKNSFEIGIWFLILLFTINNKYIILQIPPSLHPLHVGKGCLDYICLLYIKYLKIKLNVKTYD